MPDISKINAVAVADIEKLDSILAANIEKVNGLTFATAPAVSAPSAAYSVRLLDSAVGVPTYTGAAMRVRRVTGTGNTGNDDEADVAFDSGVISLDSAVSNFSAGGSNATTLGQFLNVGTVNGTAYTDADSLSPNTAAAYVDEWKDQSGNANHAAQSTPGNQPQIHDGTVNTDLITKDGKPCVYFGVASTANLSAGNIWTDAAGPVSGFAVLNIDTTQTTGFLGRWIHMENQSFHYVDTKWNFLDSALTSQSTPTPAIDTDYLLTFFHKVNQIQGQDAIEGAINGGTFAGNKPATRTLNELRLGGGQYNLDANLKEVIVWNTGQNANRATIEKDINSNYLIYQPTDQPTSGLLYDYGSATGGTDAAAAYSVRQLSDKAVICMRIRRDMGAGNPGDDDETNIGFDSNGDLDTQAIADFCGTGTGYVTRWWDQSTNGNHADQPVGGTGSNTSQPQIYNGTAVITANGKPAFYFNLSKLELISVSWGSTRTVFTVVQPVLFDSFDPVFGTRDSSGNFASLIATTGNYKMQQYPSGGFNNVDTGVTITTDQQLIYTLYDGTGSEIGKDAGTATAISLQSANAENHSIGTRGTDGADGEFYMQEHIIYVSDESSNRTGIETDIMTHFNIP